MKDNKTIIVDDSDSSMLQYNNSGHLFTDETYEKYLNSDDRCISNIIAITDIDNNGRELGNIAIVSSCDSIRKMFIEKLIQHDIETRVPQILDVIDACGVREEMFNALFDTMEDEV